MKLVSVYKEPKADVILYELLVKRPIEARISHQTLPTMMAHAEFMRTKPYRYWFLIDAGHGYVGDLCVTYLNEIGIGLLPGHRRKGIGGLALKFFMAGHKPLPPIPAKRVGNWLANIAQTNTAAQRFFSQQGFSPVQVTYAKR